MRREVQLEVPPFYQGFYRFDNTITSRQSSYFPVLLYNLLDSGEAALEGPQVLTSCTDSRPLLQ